MCEYLTRLTKSSHLDIKETTIYGAVDVFDTIPQLQTPLGKTW